MSECCCTLLRKQSSQISSLLGCNWHLMLGALTELVSGHGTVRKNRMRGHCSIVTWTCKAFQLSAPQPSGPDTSDDLRRGLAEYFHSQRWPERAEASDLWWRGPCGSLWPSAEALQCPGPKGLWCCLHVLYVSFPLSHFRRSLGAQREAYY